MMAEAAAPKKPAAKKPTARKKATARMPRARRVLKPMTPAVREIAAEVIGVATSAALRNGEVGVKRQMSAETKGTRQGMKNRIVLDDGTVVTIHGHRPLARHQAGRKRRPRLMHVRVRWLERDVDCF